MMKQIRTHTLATAVALAACLLLLVGCGGKEDATGPSGSAGGGYGLPAGVLLSTAPDGATPVNELKADAKEGDEVVVRVIVGGRMEPIVEGRASAIVIDADVENACLAEDDHCRTPWDYCCTPQEQINANIATIQVIDADGKVIAADLSQHFEPLSILVVKGVVGHRPDPKVLSINATGIFVQPNTP